MLKKLLKVAYSFSESFLTNIQLLSAIFTLNEKTLKQEKMSMLNNEKL